MQHETAEGSGTVAFFGRTYDEALDLTREARDYIAGNIGRDRSNQSADTRLVSSCEEMRLTARMTQIMAWLLLQRAIHEGEVPRSEALKEENRLSGQDTCLGGPVIEDVNLSPRLQELMSRSRALYERVQRLDAMLAAS
jgi:regulator of CtrA degradation